MVATMAKRVMPTTASTKENPLRKKCVRIMCLAYILQYFLRFLNALLKSDEASYMMQYEKK